MPPHPSRAWKVQGLDSGLEDLGKGDPVVQRQGRAVDGPVLHVRDGLAGVDAFSEDVEHSPEQGLAHRDVETVRWNRFAFHPT